MGAIYMCTVTCFCSYCGGPVRFSEEVDEEHKGMFELHSVPLAVASGMSGAIQQCTNCLRKLHLSLSGDSAVAMSVSMGGK